jgi:hypothetical protein
MSSHSHDAGHPAPHRDRVGMGWLIGALAAGPAAWIVQLVAGYGLSSLACFPHDAPFEQSPPPGWGGEPAILLIVNGVCLLVALGGCLVSLDHWRRTRSEKAGGAHHTLEIGEGRTRFLAACGALLGAAFALAIVFDTVMIIGTPTCWSLPS